MMQQKIDFEQSRIVDCSYHRNKIEQMQNEYVNLERSSTTLVASLSTNVEESMKSKAELALEIEAIWRERYEKINELEQSHILEVQKMSVALQEA